MTTLTHHTVQAADLARPQPEEDKAVEMHHVSFSYDDGMHWAVRDASLSVNRGEWLCLVGANGSGKSTLARVLAGLRAPDSGTVKLLGHAVFDGLANSGEYRTARRGIAAVFQNPEDQIVTTVVEDDVAFGPENLEMERADISRNIAHSLHDVGLDDRRGHDPTRMSGGQQQRVAIAGMLAMDPTMMVLDEPTAMLDSIARQEVMGILDYLHARGTTIIEVTHRMEETRHADRIVRMKDGRIVSDAPKASAGTGTTGGDDVDPDGRLRAGTGATGTETDAHRAPGSHPAGSLPDRIHCAAPSPDVIIDVSHVCLRYPDSDRDALHDVSLQVHRGETVAVMGRNGAGKSTLARLLGALERPTRGTVTVAGINVAGHARSARRSLRRQVGYVMQNPERQLFASSVRRDIAYGPINQGLNDRQVDARVSDAMRLLNIEGLAERSPFSLSGGQQRLVAIAGVVACDPSVLILDEPAASLDAEAGRLIHDLIRSLQSRSVTIILITHSMHEAQSLADRIITLPSAPRKPRDGSTTGRDSIILARRGKSPVTAAGPSGARADTETVPVRRSRSFTACLDPRVKMVCFLVLMFTAFLVTTPPQLALTATLVLSLIALSAIRPMRLLASIHGYLVLFGAMALLNMVVVRTGETLVHAGPIVITTSGISVAVLYTCRLALMIILGAVLIDTTTPTELTDGFASLLSPLDRHGLHVQELALVMSLALRFLPTLGRESRSIADAQSARGGSIETGSPWMRIRALVAIVVPVLVGTLRHADNLSLALDARCYEEGVRRTHWRELHVRLGDYAFMAISALYIAFLLTIG